MTRLLTSLFLLSGLGLSAQEVWVSGGGLREVRADRSTYTWQLGYRHTLKPKLGLGFAWTNEGHLPTHHRDGYSLQLWWCLVGWESPWSLALGLGPYRSYDTQPHPEDSHVNQHGLGGAATLQLQYASPTTAWSGYLQAVALQIPGQVDTVGLQGGAGYRFGPSAFHGRRRPTRSSAIPDNVLSLFLGRTVLNSMKSEGDEAWIVEYRRALSRHWSLTASYANEGDPILLRRDGLALQAWIGGGQRDGRLYLGVGAGPHLARIQTNEAGETDRDAFRRIGLRITMGVGWRPDPDWVVQGAWHRTYSSYDRDTDMFVAGLGFLW